MDFSSFTERPILVAILSIMLSDTFKHIWVCYFDTASKDCTAARMAHFITAGWGDLMDQFHNLLYLLVM